jgi:tRNA(adenine34) deaminase
MTAKSPERTAGQAAIDAAMMAHCVELSASAAKNGEFPFASLICRGSDIVAESTNQVALSADVTRHAELVAISQAQKSLGSKDLSGCTLYSNIEPCVMCSFPIRETRISRVIYAIRSPFMGGLSKWNVLRDSELSEVMPEAFGPVPEVIVGLGVAEAEAVWRKWNPLIWRIIKHRGCFETAPTVDGPVHHPAIPDRGGLLRKILMLHRLRRPV